MKKAILFIATFVLVVVILTAFANKPSAPGTGYKAPAIAMSNDTTDTVLDNYQGEYLLLTFWSSSDAGSRIRCNEYTRAANHTKGLSHIGVNFDSSKSLFDEIVRRDNLTTGEQYHVEGNQAANIMESYHLDRGLHTFLINPKGIIVAVDPETTTLNNLLI